jgi:adhesin transport system membrane fusion protein
MNLEHYSLSYRIRPLPARGPRWIIRVGILGFIALIVWAYVGKIDQTTRAPAQIIAAQRTQVVQAADGGVLTSLLIHEGDVVTAGQLIAVLEQGRSQALTQDSEAKVAALNITLDRLAAEINNRPLNLRSPMASYAKYTDYIINQENLYRVRRRSIEQDLSNLQTNLDLLKQELQMNETLLATGDVSRADVLRLKRQVADIQGQMTTRLNKYLQEAQTDMSRAQEDLNTQTESLRDRNQQLRHTELKSPAAGVVKNVLINTIGGVLRPGEVLVEIVPTDSELTAEAKVSSSDIAFVKLGQSVTINLDAYDPGIFGSLTGKVSYISADTLSDPSAVDLRQPPRQPYYRVMVKIDSSKYLESDKRSLIKVLPGMTASVSIKSKERSVLSYLLKPLNKTLVNSLGEH